MTCQCTKGTFIFANVTSRAKMMAGYSDDALSNHDMFLFFAQQDFFGMEIKKTLVDIPMAEDLICLMVIDAMETVEKAYILTPQRKLAALKSISMGLVTLESDGDDSIFKRKKLNKEKVSKILKVKEKFYSSRSQTSFYPFLETLC
jgi:hypothetical protein